MKDDNKTAESVASAASPAPVLEEKPLESLVDNTKLPLQENNQTSTGTVKEKFYKKPIFKKIVVPLIILLVLVTTFSIVAEIIRRGTRTIQNKGEIVWWGTIEEDVVIAPLIADFQAKNPDVRVTYIRQSEKDYAERLYNSLKKGSGPDIFEIHTSWVPDFRGLLSTVPASVMSDEDYKNTYLPAIYSSLKTKDGLVGIPLYYDALTLYINVDIFNSAHKEPPKTWNDVLFLSDPDRGGLTLKSGGDLVQSAIALGNTSNVDHWQDIIALILYQNNINPANPDIKLTNQAISYFREFQKSGVWNNRLPASTVSFARGNLAMYFGTMSRAPEILQLNPSIRFKTVPLPQLPNNSPKDPQYSYTNYFFQAVDKNSTNEQIAWELLKFMTEADSVSKLNSQRKTIRALEYPSPRRDMMIDFEKDSVLGSILTYSDVAKTWYLADEAFDSEGGINANITGLYKEAIDDGKIDEGFVTELKSTLAKFGVSVK